jgi:hypothetical protein
MKKILTIAALGGLFAAGTLQAQVNIYIAGSTAFRANVFRSVKASFDGGTWTSINPANASSGTGVYTAQGTMSSLYGGQIVTVYASFNGSVQGLEDLLNNTSVTFTNITPGGAAVNTVPTVTFSDADKVSTLAANAPVTETHIAILPFTYCRNYYTPTTVTNLTGHQLQSLWANGLLKLSYFTGKDSDTNDFMYVTGRNKDSGSRVVCNSDAYFTGTPILYGFNTTAPTTWAIMNQNLNGSIYGFGYSSGGNEAVALTNQNATAMNAIGNVVGAACVGYEGLNDALAVAGSACTGSPKNNGGGNCAIIAYDGVLPFNGYVPGSSPVPAYPDFTPIIKGQYSLWSYECMEMLNTHTSDATYQYYTNFVSQIDNDLLQTELNGGNSAIYGPVTALRLSEMKSSRSSVGGAITPN